ncbi:MAG: cell division protein FtsL [Methylococcaceae bacterium]
MKILLVLISVAVLSALGVVYTKYRVRMLFAETQRLEQELIAADEEWGRLQLEQNTWAEHSRIETLARTRLGMVLPSRDAVIYIRP